MVIQIILALYSLWTYGIGKYPLFFGKLADICVLWELSRKRGECNKTDKYCRCFSADIFHSEENGLVQDPDLHSGQLSGN